MMTLSNGNIFRVTGPLCGEFAGNRRIPLTKPVTRSFDVLFWLAVYELNYACNNNEVYDLGIA